MTHLLVAAQVLLVSTIALGQASPSAQHTVQAPGQRSYAIIVTNNRSLHLSRPDLSYADDDGVQYAQLFSELFGAKQVELLTRLDNQTQALYPKWKRRTRPPTKAMLEKSIQGLRQRLLKDRANKIETQVYLVFAGHGDVQRGQGFLELEDDVLSSSQLDEDVVAQLPADTIHLILDSCNAYFMLNPRQPGGRRWVQTAAAPQSLMEKHSHLGAFISTSAEAVTYEWSELQSGIFSYVLRSGLRGAADTDGDQQISYRELQAFAETATASIVNDLYRPKVFSQQPKTNGLFARLPTAAPRWLVLEHQATRATVRNSQGVRILDINKEEGIEVTLLMPQRLGLHVFVNSNKTTKGRQSTLQRELPAEGKTVLGILPNSAPSIAQRGEIPVFSSLFSKPFGPKAFATYKNRSKDQTPDKHYGVSKRDVARLESHLQTMAASERDRRNATAFAYLAFAALVLPVSIGASTEFLAQQKVLGNQLLVAGIMVLSAWPSVSSLLVSSWYLFGASECETLLEHFDETDKSTEKKRSAALFATEKELESIADAHASSRTFMGVLIGAVGVGALALGGGSAIVSITDGKLPNREQAIALGVGTAVTAFSVFLVTQFRYPSERTWDLYKQQTSIE